MSATQLERFRDRGVVRVSGLLGADAVAEARAFVRRGAGRMGVLGDEAWNFSQLDGLPDHKANSRLTKTIGYSRSFAAVMNDGQALAERLAGAALTPMLDRPTLLASVPRPGPWALPHNVWHLDLPKAQNNRAVPGVQAFAMLEQLTPGGGGTVVLAGSHRLIPDDAWFSGKQLQRRLKRHEATADLWRPDAEDRERFLREEAEVDGVPLQVEELTGAPGDVYFVDMRVLHAPAANRGQAPRLMLTHRWVSEAVHRTMTEAAEAYREQIAAGLKPRPRPTRAEA